jgi:hypothetical protein
VVIRFSGIRSSIVKEFMFKVTYILHGCLFWCPCLSDTHSKWPEGIVHPCSFSPVFLSAHVYCMPSCDNNFMGGTFKSVPRPYTQLLLFMGSTEIRVIPLVFALMVDRHVGSYRQIFGLYCMPSDWIFLHRLLQK